MSDSSTQAILFEARTEHGDDLLPLIPGSRYRRKSPPKYRDSFEYTKAVRRLGRKLGYDDELLGRDGRLLGAGWNFRPPREWLRLLPEFLAYWDALEVKDRPVGSCYHDSPEAVRNAWDLGIPVADYPGMGSGWANQILPDPKHGNRVFPERVRLVCLLAKRRVSCPSHRVSIRDLRALARLPGWLLRAAIIFYSGWRIDWPALADLHRKLTPAIRESLESAKIPASQWAGIDPGYIPGITVLRSVGLRVKRWENYGYSPIVEITQIERNGLGVSEYNGALFRDSWLELCQIRAIAVFEAISSDSLGKAAEELPKLKSLAEIETEDNRTPFFRPLLETLRAYLRMRMEDR